MILNSPFAIRYSRIRPPPIAARWVGHARLTALLVVVGPAHHKENVEFPVIRHVGNRGAVRTVDVPPFGYRTCVELVQELAVAPTDHPQQALVIEERRIEPGVSIERRQASRYRDRRRTVTYR